jgi:hypothetical protein
MSPPELTLDHARQRGRRQSETAFDKVRREFLTQIETAKHRQWRPRQQSIDG